ncbi:hypothetical protein Y900_029550 [Mycolicibacterium aromaticivorans JS19b1 = JCM 16368]|uniref:Uncharacterized protein n=1 Tax=Mycolicibacterium aromaticivorans JS19b1 = JCM 16368 TaxID=1440774 RepID=A0A064C929_9MYCO|nr:hypothetical protein Y900_029550 [Mycolicibacterium aromaticivorans JS19b1 = JCM 16368]
MQACKDEVIAVQYQIIARYSTPAASTDYRDIVAVKYHLDGDTGSCSREQMITLLEQGHTAFVRGRHGHSDVGIFDLNKVKYLRTHHWDDLWDDSLVLLPTFDLDAHPHCGAAISDTPSRSFDLFSLVENTRVSASRLVTIAQRWRPRILSQ